MSEMMSQEREKALTKKVNKANTIIKWSAISSMAIIVLTLFAIVFQLFTIQDQIKGTLEQLQSNASNNHKRTQQYIRCIVLVPLDQRTEESFDKCGKEGTVDPIGKANPGQDSKATVGSTQATPPQQRQPLMRQEPETPAGAPPTPDESILPVEPQPVSVFDRLGNELDKKLKTVENMIINLEKGI